MKTLKLYPLGKTYVIEKNPDLSNKKPNDPKKKEETFCEFIEISNYDYFNDLVFSKKLIHYHFPHLYEEYLDSNILYKTL